MKHMPDYGQNFSPVSLFFWVRIMRRAGVLQRRQLSSAFFRFPALDAFDLLGLGLLDQFFHRLVYLGLEAAG